MGMSTQKIFSYNKIAIDLQGLGYVLYTFNLFDKAIKTFSILTYYYLYVT